MRIGISSTYIQVVEYTLAKEMLFWAGVGQRRDDADTLLIFEGRSEKDYFYVPASEWVEVMQRMAVDEGVFTNALHRKGALPIVQKSKLDTQVGCSTAFYEYVDYYTLLKVLVKKLVPYALVEASPFISHGARQQSYIEQYERILLDWSQKNPDHSLKFT